jgi:GH24 family phage-related lysozyme (muramidase)
MSVSHDVAFAFTAPFEGFVPHLYLDSYGIVTWGYGNAGNLADAMMLPWQHQDGSRCQPDEVIRDWKAVNDPVLSGHVASWYARLMRLRLPEAAGRVLFYSRVDEFNAALVREFPGFDGFPAPAQLATFDMAFNCGVGKLRAKFPKWHRAVAACDWMGAAAECHRDNPHENVTPWDPSDEHERRQIAVRDLYARAARAAAA